MALFKIGEKVLKMLARKDFIKTIKKAKKDGEPYTKKEKDEIRRYGATKAELQEEYDISKDEVAGIVKDMGGMSKGGMANKTTPKKKPVKKAKGGIVTKWQNKWG